MDMQTLYNHLRVKRKYGRGDVVLRLSYEEMDLIFEVFEEAGVNQDKGSEYVALIQEIARQQVEDIIHVSEDAKKPFHIVFPSGNQQKYAPGQFDVIAKDASKYEEKLKAIIFAKGAE